MTKVFGIPLRVLILIPLAFYYYDQILASLDNSHFKAVLILACVFTGVAVDLNDLTGQPHEDDDHND